MFIAQVPESLGRLERYGPLGYIRSMSCCGEPSLDQLLRKHASGTNILNDILFLG
jgi:hypothetical protein